MRIFYIIFVFLALSLNALAQSSGTDFWFAVPHIQKAVGERVRTNETNSPIELWITTEQATTIDLFDANNSLIQTKNIEANSSVYISINDSYLNQTVETVSKNALHLVSTSPISVTLYISYQISGEAITILPTDMLGKMYYSMNLYQDKLKFADNTVQVTVPQILIVATENTTVQFNPTVKTKSGRLPGSVYNVNLKKGEIYLIEPDTNSFLVHTWESDLTGTYISADKPIAVFSGHTKGAFPRMPVSNWNYKTDFMRSPYIDQMLPIESAGNEYISVPTIFQGRTTGYGTISEDKGDIIRFLAIEDNTTIFQNDEVNGGVTKLITINKGQDYKIMEQTEPSYYYTDKKVLVCQYSKSWVRNNSYTNIGEGMMRTLIPNSLWVSSTSFNCSKGTVSSFLSLIFKTKDKSKLYLDGKSIYQDFSSKIKSIKGTSYSYLSTSISSGNHNITTSKGGVRFCAYFYGNFDGNMDAFAYGSFAGITNDKSCDDSLFVEHQVDCDKYFIHSSSFDLDPYQSCTSIKNVRIDKTTSKNVELINDPSQTNTISENFHIAKIIDKSITTHFDVIIETYSGIKDTLQFDYIPESIVSCDQSLVDFGIQAKNIEKSRFVEIQNTTQNQIVIKRLFFKHNTNEFSLSNVEGIFIEPLENVQIEIKAKMLNDSPGYLIDTLVAEFDCPINQLCQVIINSGEPIIQSSDVSIDNISPFYQTYEVPITIQNSGPVDATIDNITFDNNVNFSFTQNSLVPVVIPANSSQEFIINYMPNKEVNKTHKTTASIICSNSTAANANFNIECSTSYLIFRLNNFDWGLRGITEDTNKYSADITLLNCCDSGTVKIKQISIESDTPNIFTIDNSSYASILNTFMEIDDQYSLKLYFSPKEKILYTGILKILLEKYNTQIEVTCNLSGMGITPISVLENNPSKLSVKPNPSSGNTILSYQLTKESDTEINIYDMSGKLIENIYRGYSDEKYHELNISNLVSKLSNGTYNIVIQYGKIEDSIRFVVSK